MCCRALARVRGRVVQATGRAAGSSCSRRGYVEAATCLPCPSCWPGVLALAAADHESCPILSLRSISSPCLCFVCAASPSRSSLPRPGRCPTCSAMIQRLQSPSDAQGTPHSHITTPVWLPRTHRHSLLCVQSLLLRPRRPSLPPRRRVSTPSSRRASSGRRRATTTTRPPLDLMDKTRRSRSAATAPGWHLGAWIAA